MYCTPKAVQEQILKRKLLTASGCAVTLNKDRPDAATRRPAFPDVPDDLLLLLLGYCGASSLLALETASRALLELLRSPARHKQQESLWCGCICARWPREGPALCSLGDHERRLGLRPRAPARQIYRAFSTKKDAEEDIENVVATGEGALEELAFIAVVGDFAGVASWDEESDPVVGNREFLRWQPPSVLLGPFANLEAYEQGQATVAELMGDRLDRVRQELHVIDLRSFLCVTLVSPTVPEAVLITDVNWPHTPSYLQDGDAVFFTNSSCNSMSGFGECGACCLLSPTLALRPTPDNSRLLFVDFFPEARPPPRWQELLWNVEESRYPHFFHKPEELCEFVAEIIRQTHSR